MQVVSGKAGTQNLRGYKQRNRGPWRPFYRYFIETKVKTLNLNAM